MNGVKWENDATLVGLLKKACTQERVDVAMHRFHIPLRPARCFSNGHSSCAGHNLEQFPALAREHFEKKSRGLEADNRFLRFPVKCSQESLIGLLSR